MGIKIAELEFDNDERYCGPGFSYKNVGLECVEVSRPTLRVTPFLAGRTHLTISIYLKAIK